MTNDEIYIFDCDGVLMDSNERKVQFFIDAIIGAGGSDKFAQAAGIEFRLNFGRTRSEHFKSIKSLPSCNLNENELESARVAYSRKIQTLYMTCSVIPTTFDFLEVCSADQVYVVSASDEGELRASLPLRFKNVKKSHIFGGPKSKTQNLLDLTTRMAGVKSVFFGDAIKDAEAANAAGVRFVGLSKYSADPEGLIRHCNFYSFPVMKDIGEWYES